MELVLKFAEDFKPDIDVFIGDLLNLEGVSKWSINKWKTRNEEKIKKDFDEANSFLDTRLHGGPKKQYYLGGNHEEWLDKYIERNPELDGELDIPTRLDLAIRGIKYIPYMLQREKPLSIGKLDYVHGWYCEVHHTKKTSWEVSRNTIYGHTHDVQSHTKKEIPNKRGRIIVQSIGHLSNEKKFQYLKSPCNWMKAFGIALIAKDGSFTHYTIPIPKYQFIWNDKIYKN